MSSNEYGDDWEISDTNDLDLISRIVESDDRAKGPVTKNPRLFHHQMVKLANDKSAYVRRELAMVSHIPPDVLQLLCTDEVEHVRVRALCNPLTDLAYYSEAILTGNFSTASKKDFCWDYRVGENFEVFKFFWKSVKGIKPILIRTLDGAKRYSLPNIDDEVFSLVHDEIRRGSISKKVREAYTGADKLALPELLDSLKDDSHYPVIYNISLNSAAWVSTHEYLIDTYPTAEIQIAVARVTRDNDLLNKIYQGTQDKEIRYWVGGNPVFVSH